MEPLLGILLETVTNDPLETGRHALVRHRQIGRVLLENRRHGVGRRVALKRPLSRKHLVENRSESEYVRSGIGRPAANLLWRHVAESPEHDSRLRSLRRRRKAGRGNAFLLMR